MTKRRTFKVLGAVIWLVLFSTVMTSIIRSENLNATPHAAGKLHQVAAR